MIELAKPALDVGLFTNELDAMLEFWQREARLPFSELLPLGGGVAQHRHAIGQSVLKINHARTPLTDAARGGIRRLSIATPFRSTPLALTDPDGNAVQLVPVGFDGIRQLRVELVVSDVDAHGRFYGDVLGLPARDARTFLCGDTEILLVAGRAWPHPALQARGYRYFTIQVFDVKGVHAGILARGGREGRAPVRVGDVAHISLVRDPDGNWLEISQRRSLTGSLD
jgi:catechol 2,3-dioxygenase-like lactoylglutathione lyase family enzyme